MEIRERSIKLIDWRRRLCTQLAAAAAAVDNDDKFCTVPLFVLFGSHTADMWCGATYRFKLLFQLLQPLLSDRCFVST